VSRAARAAAASGLLAGAVLSVACEKQCEKPPQLVQQAVNEPAYALAFPASLHNLVSTFEAREAEVRRILAAVKNLTPDAAGTDKASLRAMLEAAHREGRGSGYVDARRQYDAANDFFSDTKEELLKKPLGNAQYAVRQRGCDVDVATPLNKNIDEVYAKTILARLRKASEAHRMLERFREVLPKEKITLLETRLDEVAFASYVVGVEMPDIDARIQRMVGEGPEIKKTLDRAALEEDAWKAMPNRSPTEVKAAEKRAAELREAASNLGVADDRAKTLLKTSTAKREQLEGDYVRTIRTLATALAPK
jgi:hypothetical protein